MKQAVVLLVVALAVMGSAKPYESYRKPSVLTQYPFYGPNYLYGTDRLSEEFLKRLFAQNAKDSAVEVPFVHVPDASNADERLWQLLEPQEKPVEERQPKSIEEDEIDAAEDREPLKDVPKEAAVDREEKDNNEKPIEKEQEGNPKKPEQQQNEGDKEKEIQQQKPDQPSKEEDKEHKQQKPGQLPKEEDKERKQQPPKEGEKDKERKQQKPGQLPKEDDKRKETQPNKGNRPGGRKPFDGLARRPGNDGPRGDRDKPERSSSPQPPLPPRRQPEMPLVQINVNVGSPVL